jgi:glycosyltransferase 2 family protein
VKKPSHPNLRRALKGLFVVFLLFVAVLLVRYARSVDWAHVGQAIAGYRTTTLIAAAALTMGSYLLYCGYDLAARVYSHHALSTRRVMVITLISYAFSLNIGAVIGSAGFRYRLYSRSGLNVGTINRIVAFSISTNWLGYAAVAGTVFAAHVLSPPPDWEIDTTGLRLLGFALLAVVVAYLIACRVSHGRVFHLRGRHFRLPSLRLALLQLMLASANWSVMAALLFVLLGQQVAYPVVLGVLLLSAVATAIAHIPAGIGVLEAVFLALLGHLVPQPQLFASLLVYRAFYYLVPLLLGVVLYAAFEAKGKREAVSDER